MKKFNYNKTPEKLKSKFNHLDENIPEEIREALGNYDFSETSHTDIWLSPLSQILMILSNNSKQLSYKINYKDDMKENGIDSIVICPKD